MFRGLGDGPRPFLRALKNVGKCFQENASPRGVDWRVLGNQWGPYLPLMSAGLSPKEPPSPSDGMPDCMGKALPRKVLHQFCSFGIALLVERINITSCVAWWQPLLTFLVDR